MKNDGCAIVAAATVIVALGLAPMAAQAGCNVRNPTACTADTPPLVDPAAAPQAQPEASQPQTEPAAKPLQLKRYIKLPAQQSASRSAKRRSAKRPSRHKISSRNRRKTVRIVRSAPAKVSATATASAEAGAAPLTPKAISTISISARALALAPTKDDRTVGFAAETTPWNGDNAFAPAGAGKTALPDSAIARFGEFNEIDRAAAASKTAGGANSDRLAAASLVTPAKADATSAQADEPKQPSSWFAWLYGKAVNAVIVAAIAIRALFT